MGPVTAYTNRISPNSALLSNLRRQVYTVGLARFRLAVVDVP